MSPLKVPISELEAVMAAARPLAVDRRDAFLQAIVGALQGRTETGAGAIYRVCRELQRAHFDAPDLSQGRPSRWR